MRSITMPLAVSLPLALSVPLFMLAGCSTTAPMAKVGVSTATLPAQGMSEHHDATPHHLSVKISRPEGGAPIASTSAILPENRELSFETSSGTDRAEARLVVDVERHRQTADSPYVVRVEWKEKTLDGRVVEWSPTLAVRAGTKATAVVDWGNGDGRVLELELEDLPGQAGAPADAPADRPPAISDQAAPGEQGVAVGVVPSTAVPASAEATAEGPSAMLDGRAATTPAAEAVP